MDPPPTVTPRVPYFVEWLINHSLDLREQDLRFEYTLLPFLLENQVTKQIESIKDISEGTDWVLKIVQGTLDPEELKKSWKKETPKWTAEVNKIFAKLMAAEFWKVYPDTSIVHVSTTQQLTRRSSRSWQEKYVPVHQSSIWILPNCFFEVHENNPVWRQLCESIEAFCHRLGIPGASYDPSENMIHIRSYFLRQTPTAETELRNQIAELKEKSDKQKRIIAALHFRFVLEKLPGPDIPGNHATPRWKAFWTSAFDAAVPQHGPPPNPNHPLAKLKASFPTAPRSFLRAQGELLYNTLSTDIHNYTGAAELEEVQWGQSEIAILKALAPSILLIDPDTGLETMEYDWVAERNRLGSLSLSPI